MSRSISFVLVTIVLLLVSYIASEPVLTITSPTASQEFRIGDALHFSFTVNQDFLDDRPAGLISISFDNGFSYYELHGADGYNPESPDWGDFVWVIPETLKTIDGFGRDAEIYTVSNSVKIQIDDMYGDYPEIYVSPTFAILEGTSVESSMPKQPKLSNLSVHPNPGSALFTIQGAGETYQIYDLAGRCVAKSPFAFDGFINSRIDLSFLPVGSYLCKSFSGNKQSVTRIFIER